MSEVPYQFKITRDLFLRARRDQFQEVCRTAGPDDILIGPPDDDEIICDRCNVEILDQVIQLSRRGTYVLCHDCVVKGKQ